MTTPLYLCYGVHLHLTAIVLLGIFRELSPAIFCAPQNITKHALSFISALYSLNSDPESNSALVLFVSVKNRLTLRPLRVIIFPTKILSEDPYLMSFIRRVLCLYRERFSSFSRYATRLRVEAFFLPPLHRGASTIAVKSTALRGDM